MLSFSEQLIQPYLEGMRRTGTGLLEVRDFLRVKLDDLWLPVQKSSTSVRQRSGRCWHPARTATGCEQNGGNLTQLRHRLQSWMGRTDQLARCSAGRYLIFDPAEVTGCSATLYATDTRQPAQLHSLRAGRLSSPTPPHYAYVCVLRWDVWAVPSSRQARIAHARAAGVQRRI